MIEKKEMTKAEIEAQVEFWEERIFAEERADNYYYTSGRRTEDLKHLRYWQEQLKKF